MVRACFWEVADIGPNLSGGGLESVLPVPLADDTSTGIKGGTSYYGIGSCSAFSAFFKSLLAGT